MASSSSSHPKPAPHLLFTEDHSIPSCFNLFGLGDRKVYSLIPPTPSVCLGSGHGWLVIADLVSDPSLFNPATGQTLPLPKLSTLDSVTPILDSGRLFSYQLDLKYVPVGEVKLWALPIGLIHRALPIADTNGDVTVFLILYSPTLALAFAKPGDVRWTVVEHSGFLDVVSHKDQIFSVMRTGEVVGWGDSFLTEPVTVIAQTLAEAKAIERSREIVTRDFSFFLATSSSRDLLRVRMEMVREDRTAHVKVHRVEYGERGLKELVEVKSLGEDALLLGANSAICVVAADVPGLRRDCVYLSKGTTISGDRRSDVGIYSMEDGSVEPISIKIPHYPHPSWIMGSFD